MNGSTPLAATDVKVLYLCAWCSWRSSLSSERLKGAAKTTYGGAMAKAAHEAVDAARDLLLQKVEVRTS
jgi:hypothetical protein